MIYTLMPEKCIACGLCQVLAPHIFDYTSEGIVIFSAEPTSLSLAIADEWKAEGLSAYKKCPTRAITIEA